jgi:hypothetical protein
MKYIVHQASGTVFVADHCVIVDVPDEVLTSLDGDDYFDDDTVCEYAETHGKPINTTDLKWGNCIAYSPSAIREEILEGLRDDYPDYKAALEWGLSATDDQLNEVASYIIQNDSVWETYKTDLLDGLREGLRWSQEDSK